MNKKQTIRLNESQLMRIVNESVKKILNENEFSEGFGSIARKYGVGGERFRGRSAEDVDREKGDTTPNVIIECSPYRLTYSNKDGYVIRIEKQTGTVYCSKEPGGKSYSTTSMGAVLNGTPHNCDTLGTVREISSNNIPDKMLVSSKKSAFQIAIWMKLMICGNIQCDESLTKTSTWLAF